jgi:hypothetical protein
LGKGMKKETKNRQLGSSRSGRSHGRRKKGEQERKYRSNKEGSGHDRRYR